MHLRQPVFTYSTCGPFTKNRERIHKFKETGDSRCIYKNELDKACFQRDIAYCDFKDLNIRAALDKICVTKHLVLLKIQNMMDIKVELLQWSIDFLMKNSLSMQINLLLVLLLKIRKFQRIS